MDEKRLKPMVVWGFILVGGPLDAPKQILGVEQTTQNNFVYGQLGRFPLFFLHRHYRMIKFWLKIIKGDTRKCTQIYYNMM